MGGTNNCNGTVEVRHQMEWRPVGSGWSYQSSSVVCRQLGCGSAVSTETRTTPHQPSWKIGSKCIGTETSLKECGGMEEKSDTVYSVYLICSGNKQ